MRWQLLLGVVAMGTVGCTPDGPGKLGDMTGHDGGGTPIAATQPKPRRIEKVGTLWTNGVGMSFARIPAGDFVMGGELSPSEAASRFGGPTDWYERELPRHHVTIRRTFMMAIYPVTRRQFARFVAATDYHTDAEKEGWSYGWDGGDWGQRVGLNWRGRDAGLEQADDHPVVCVSWNDAKAFCRWLNEKEGRHYRLPSEAEWEYACRAGTQTIFPWGNDADAGQGWANCADLMAKAQFVNLDTFNWSDGWAYTSPVGVFRPNAWGLYDMIGNVWEWCQDGCGEYPAADVVDPLGPDYGTSRMVRGGSWSYGPRGSRIASRAPLAPEHGNDCVGFRVVVDEP